ncbi:hypothetical protein [Anabaena azotica]|uniref:hypothetical protein n=1 Tax=Anabaena azotica TaxID=197653 RepID=UPI0039A568C8
MYFVDTYSPIENYNHVHSKIIYEHLVTPNQPLIANAFNQSFIIFHQEPINQETSTATNISAHYLSQVPGTDNDKKNDSVGENSLQTEPKYPEQKPFKPQKLPLVLENKKARPSSSPGITMLTPSAYGKSWGRASVGVGLQSRARFTDTADGALGVGFGLGDAKKSIGLDINISVVDISSFEDGSISWKLHRQLPYDFAVAVGVKNFVTFGNTDGGTSGYGVITKMFRLQDSEQKPFSRLYVSAGVGGGQFRSESDVRNQIDSVGVFGSAALRIAQPVSAIVEWSGQDLGLGVSVAPFKNIPLVITPGISDITGNAGDGTRFILGIGYSVAF